MSSNSEETPPKKRPGRLTMLNLGWIAERIRKTERIREQLKSDAYTVDSEKIAKALLNDER